jgi:hypothetical protein
MGLCGSKQGLSLKVHRACRSFAWNHSLMIEHCIGGTPDDMEHGLLGK